MLTNLVGEKLDLYNAVISIIYNLSYVWVVWSYSRLISSGHLINEIKHLIFFLKFSDLTFNL